LMRGMKMYENFHLMAESHRHLFTARLLEQTRDHHIQPHTKCRLDTASPPFSEVQHHDV
jgi:hypothetical protein